MDAPDIGDFVCFKEVACSCEGSKFFHAHVRIRCATEVNLTLFPILASQFPVRTGEFPKFVCQGRLKADRFPKTPKSHSHFFVDSLSNDLFSVSWPSGFFHCRISVAS